MSLARAGKFFAAHHPVHFPEALVDDFRPALPSAVEFSQSARQILADYQKNGGALEWRIFRHFDSTSHENDVTRFLARAAFLGRLADLHQRMTGKEGDTQTHRLNILQQRELINLFLQLDPMQQAVLIDIQRDVELPSDVWSGPCAGARAVVKVICHMIRPNRLFFFPRVHEDMIQKIDLIVLDANGDGACCQVKGSKAIDDEMHIEVLTEKPEDKRLARFYAGTLAFNKKYSFNFRPVLFTVGW